MAKTEHTVLELVGMIERGTLRLPELQREYVWRATRVRDLLDSLYRGYPSGVILAWQTDEQVALTEFAVESRPADYGSPLLLLDGQQRLTSLAAVIRGKPVQVRGRKRPVDILFNLEHPEALPFATEVNETAQDELSAEETPPDEVDRDFIDRMEQKAFVVASPRLEALPHWVRVADAFARGEVEVLRKADLSDLADPRYERYATRLRRLRAIGDYAYRMDVLERTMSYEEVTEIFVRVNSLGAKLRSSDLALAQITARWRGSLAEFQAFQKRCDDLGFPLDLGVHLRALVAVATDQSKFNSVSNLSGDNLRAAWKQTVDGMLFALNFTKANLGVDSPALLSSPFVLITLAYWSHVRGRAITSEEADAMRLWALRANAKGRYSRGSSETILDQDLAVLRDGGGPIGLSDRLRQQMGRLNVLPEDLVARSPRSGLFKTLFLAHRAGGACDWSSKLRIDVRHAGSADAIEYHHLWPKAHLARVRPDLRRDQVDDLANLAFIGAATNKAISDKAPAQYMQQYEAERWQEQDIPVVDFDDPAEFDTFIERRRALLADRLNDFLGTSAPER